MKRWQLWLVPTIATISTAILVLGLFASNQGDVAWYQWIIHDWLNGKLPYLGHAVEYPPYALAIFFLPWLLGDATYLLNFMFLALALDIGIKVVLFFIGRRSKGNKRAYLPLVIYSVGVIFLSYFYLQRFDLWPALVALLAVWLFWKGKPLSSGAALAAAIGVKLYPAVFVVPLLAVAVREKNWKRFTLGLVIGLVPLVVLSFFLPWWNFIGFQDSRGLQVESLYASLLWLLHWLGGVDATWIRTTAWFEVQGAVATAVIPFAKAFFVISVLGSMAYGAWAVFRDKLKSSSLAVLARLSLVPLLAFVAFNLVISPQYLIWLVPIAALAVLEGSIWPVVMIVVAAMLTPFFYPVANYFGPGLDLFQTAALVLRNLLLAAAWVWLMIELYARKKPYR